jgi:hypothetical protein
LLARDPVHVFRPRRPSLRARSARAPRADTTLLNSLCPLRLRARYCT